MTKIGFSLPVLVLAGALLLTACNQVKAPASDTEVTLTKISGAESTVNQPPDYNALLGQLPANPAPSLANFSTIDMAGETVDQTLLAEDDLTMVNIWATFCGPCIKEMPELGELAVEYGDKGLQIVGLVADVQDQDGSISPNQMAKAAEIIQKTKANYLHLLPSNDLITARLSQVSAVPETIFLDKDGNQVGKSYLGARSKSQWISVIDTLLKEVQG